MSVSNHYLLHVVAMMSSVAPVSYRRLFNGYGIYHRHVQFALVIHERLYFRADDDSRGLYLEKNMAAFLPANISALDSNFFQLPEEVLANPAELLYWMRIAVEAAEHSYSLEDDEPSVGIHIRHLKVR